MRGKYKKTIVMIAIAVFAIAGIFWAMDRLEIQKAPTYVIFIPKTDDTTNDFWAALFAGAEIVAKEHGVKFEIMAPREETDIEMQNTLIREAIQKKPDAIALAPASYTESVAVAKEIKAAGIPLILIDSALEEEVQDAIIATDNYVAGEKMAEPIKKVMKEDDVIAIISHVKESSTAMEREKGLRAGLGEKEQNITETLYSNSDYDKAYEVTKELLQRKEVDFLACLNEYSAVGAARAVTELGLEEKIKIIGFDNSLEEMKYLEAGVFEAIVVQKAFNMGYIGIETAILAAQGAKVLPKRDSGSALIPREEMYDEKNQELLFPFYGK